MALYFTVDGRGRFSEGKTVALEPVAPTFGGKTPTEFVRMAEDLCPDGISSHGKTHLIPGWRLADRDPHVVKAAADAHGEVILELTRRWVAPTAPSRLQSMFGFTTLDAARDFRTRFRGGTGSIYQVESDEGHVVDFHLVLTLGNTALASATYARQYWLGLPNWTTTPIWEAVIPLPATIGDRVE